MDYNGNLKKGNLSGKVFRIKWYLTTDVDRYLGIYVGDTWRHNES